VTQPVTVPLGFRLQPDVGTQCHDGGRVVVGGSPRRVLRLTARGAVAANRLLDGQPVSGNGDGLLARRLLDAGIAHPVPSRDVSLTIDVIVPVYDDAAGLESCLAALGSDLPVIVVDDGSSEQQRIAAVAAYHGARVVRHDHNAGPAAARNTGARQSAADVVAFVDSDAIVAASTLRRLVAHLSDTAVTAAAPRGRSREAGHGVLGVVAAHWSPLDLGARPGAVAPTHRVSYVPSTVLVMRRQALLDLGGFDESLRQGEDVDLVWRVAAAGETVRYDPSLQARHAEPQTWSKWLRRRFLYGTSGAALTRRHGESAAPLVVPPAPAASVLATLCGAPVLGAAIAGATALRLRRRLRAADVPTADATIGALVAPVQAALGAARWAGQLWWPAVLLAATSRRRRPAAACVLVAPPLVEWLRRRPPVDPLRWTAALWADDVAYGMGVWAGCARERTMRPLLPRIARARGSRL